MTDEMPPQSPPASSSPSLPLPAPDSPVVLDASGSLISLAPIETGDDLADAMSSLQQTIAFSAGDWGATRREAWIYGIILGWCDKDAPDSLCSNCDPYFEMCQGSCLIDQLAEKFNWDRAAVDTWLRHRAAWKARAA